MIPAGSVTHFTFQIKIFLIQLAKNVFRLLCAHLCVCCWSSCVASFIFISLTCWWHTCPLCTFTASLVQHLFALAPFLSHHCTVLRPVLLLFRYVSNLPKISIFLHLFPSPQSELTLYLLSWARLLRIFSSPCLALSSFLPWFFLLAVCPTPCVSEPVMARAMHPPASHSAPSFLRQYAGHLGRTALRREPGGGLERDRAYLSLHRTGSLGTHTHTLLYLHNHFTLIKWSLKWTCSGISLHLRWSNDFCAVFEYFFLFYFLQSYVFPFCPFNCTCENVTLWHGVEFLSEILLALERVSF